MSVDMPERVRIDEWDYPDAGATAWRLTAGYDPAPEGKYDYIRADLHDELRRLAQAVVAEWEVYYAGSMDSEPIESLRAYLARKETP